MAAIKAELAAAAAKADEVLIDLTQKQNTFKNIKFGFFFETVVIKRTHAITTRAGLTHVKVPKET